MHLTCTVCNETKPAEAMVKDARIKSGYSSRCKECLRKQNKARDFAKYNENRRHKHRSDPVPKLLSGAKHRAEQQGVPFDLTASDVHVPCDCPALGIPLLVGERVTDNSPTLDKIIPALGYIRGNVVVISHLANRIKSNATPEQIRAVADFLDKRKALVTTI